MPPATFPLIHVSRPFFLFAVTAVSGLALANAPDFAHSLPFLQPLANDGGLASGLATALAPAIAAAVFITAALAIVDCELYRKWSEAVADFYSRGYGSPRICIHFFWTVACFQNYVLHFDISRCHMVGRRGRSSVRCPSIQYR